MYVCDNIIQFTTEDCCNGGVDEAQWRRCMSGEGKMGKMDVGDGEAWETMVKIYAVQLKQKAELRFVMKSGWVESDRRTTLLWHLFGRCVGRNGASQQAIAIPRQLIGRHRTLHDVPAACVSHGRSEGRPTVATSRADEEWVRVSGYCRGEDMDALCCGSA